MADDRETRRRLRSVELRSEDVVLVRMLLAIVLRVVGGVLLVLGLADAVSMTVIFMRPGAWSPSTIEIIGFYGDPAIRIIAGAVAFIMSGTLARRLAPARVPTPRCPACGYQLTTLDDGRCTECAYELTPAREGPMSSTDRLLLVRSLVATAIRVAGVVTVAWGVGRFVLLGLVELMAFTRPLAEQYRADRELVWSTVLIALGLTAYTLAEWLARVVLLGIGRKEKGPAPVGADPRNDSDPDLS
jgi:hypothetical protein